ncbi:DoxX family protein [Amphibiibacter pelophylacis]|uniref:DoxX family protein n=1 Tax=Amphibiibacter pelophylacis TaxID=1799477 RepID=A0ACC6NYJ7_9BURK
MTSSSPAAAVARLVRRCFALFEQIPYSLIAFLGRFSIAAVFWLSGQTKVEGFAIDLIGGSVQLGWPHLSDSAISLFQTEYALPLLPPALAALMAAIAEHVFSTMLLLGIGSRFAALGLLGMTSVIEIFVYPDAYPTHGTWATILLLIIWRGPGWLSLDHWISRRFVANPVGR